jgi:hypothetical protein
VVENERTLSRKERKEMLAKVKMLISRRGHQDNGKKT